MKIIDLLNKIANGEEVPKKIKWRDKIWTYNNYNQDYVINDTDLLGYGFCNHRTLDFINDEVEIIEEEKKIPDEININLAYIDKEYLLDKEDVDRKINEIINRHNILVDKVSDYLKSKGE